MNKKKILIIISILAGVIFVGFIIFVNVDILQERAFIFLPESVPSTTVALIFGGGLNKDGTLNDMVSDRMAAGVSLFRSGKVGQLMITGDDGRVHSDEVDAMREVAVALGVPVEKILVDRHGYRTYDSCYRAAKVYGIKRVIGISQFFHLPRIIFICERFGIGTTGVAADFRNYGFASAYMNVREVGARLKAWWQVNVTNPEPLVMSKE
ncbi:MAG: ElyC/SanA/YdcF family protein [Patescibacteria group bacterium]